MEWIFDSNTPIYTQLVEQLTLRIVTSVYAPGQRIPPVRELAVEAGVNPNTMQRALGELERLGLVYSQRTSGRFVTEDITMIETAKQELMHEIDSAVINALGKFLSSATEAAENKDLDPQDVFGDFGPDGLGEPRCAHFINGNYAPMLSGECTLKKLSAVPQAADAIRGVIGKTMSFDGSKATLESMTAQFPHLKFIEVCGFSLASDEEKKAAMEVLAQIPNPDCE